MVEHSDRPQQSAAISKYDAEFLQVLIRQVTQNVGIDCVFAEVGLIPPKAKASEPVSVASGKVQERRMRTKSETFLRDPEGSTPSRSKASQPAGSELCMDGGNTIREA